MRGTDVPFTSGGIVKKLTIGSLLCPAVIGSFHELSPSWMPTSVTRPLTKGAGQDHGDQVCALTCRCQLFGHVMRPVCTHGSAHRVDLVVRPSQAGAHIRAAANR